MTKLDGNGTTTISHHPYILCYFASLCCVQRKAVEQWSAQAVLNLYGMLECQLLLPNMADMGGLVRGRLWSEQCCVPH